MSSEKEYNPINIHLNWQQVYEHIKSVQGIGASVEYLHRCFQLFILEQLDGGNRQAILGILIKIKNIYQNRHFEIGYDSSKVDGNLIVISNENRVKLEEYFGQLKEIFQEIKHIDVYVIFYDLALQAFDDDRKVYKAKADELFGEITTQSLYGVFAEQRKNFSKSISNNTKVYYGLLAFLFIVSVLMIGGISIPAFDCVIAIDFSVINQGSIFEILFRKVSILIPIIWALLFISKRIKEDKALEQSYLHKEVIAKSYQNYLDFFKSNFSDKKELQENLSKVLVDSFMLNPALLLEKTTAEQIPSENLLMKVVDKLPIKDKASNP